MIVRSGKGGTVTPDDDLDLAQVSCRAHADSWTLTFARRSAHDRTRLWAALTDPALMQVWAPSVPDRDLGSPGPAALTTRTGGACEQHAATVHLAQPPVRLDYSTQDDHLSWQLDPAPAGTLITLRHTFLDQEWADDLAAGWHQHLDQLETLLSSPAIGHGDCQVAARSWLRQAYDRALTLSAPIFTERD
jgi:uncharacterized protein YndB with AHSA1/START domain